MQSAMELIRWSLPTCATAFLLCASVNAGEPAAACSGPEYRQFDFWLGDWEVSEKGKVAGRNRIARILGGCVLHESWSGTSGLAGHSYTLYDKGRRRWHQTWVDGSGSVRQLWEYSGDGGRTWKPRFDGHYRPTTPQ